MFTPTRKTPTNSSRVGETRMKSRWLFRWAIPPAAPIGWRPYSRTWAAARRSLADPGQPTWPNNSCQPANNQSLGNLDRQFPDTFARQREDRVADRRSNRRRARLANPAARFLTRDDVHFDCGRLGHGQQCVVVEVALLDAPIFNRDLVLERRRQPEHDAAL